MNIQPCDFRRSAALSSEELRKLRERHTEFLAALAQRLADYLSLEVGLKLTGFESLEVCQYLERVPGATHSTLFRFESEPTVGVLDFPPRLGLILADRLLGGTGRGAPAGSALGEIESALLDQIILIIFDGWGRLWRPDQATRPVIVSHQSSGDFLRGLGPGQMLLAVAAEMRVGDCAESFRFAWPLASFTAAHRRTAPPAQPPVRAALPKIIPAQWNPTLNEMPVRIQTRCQALELSARALAKLKPGDVLRFEGSGLDSVEVLFERTPKFHARLGMAGSHWAAELTQAYTP